MCIKEVKKFQFKSYIWTVFLCTVLLLSWGQPFCSAIFFHKTSIYLIKRTDDLISVKRVSSYRSAFTVHRKLRFILYKLILYFFAPFCYCHGCNHFVQSFFTKLPVIETDTIKFRIKTNWYITSG